MSHANKPPNDDSTASVSNSTSNRNITTRPVDKLELHDFSKKIFDQDPPNGRFIQNIKDGLEKPLIINEDDEVIDGVRRLKAANILDWDEIDVHVQSFSDEGEEKLAILRHNDYRTETFSQKVSIALKFQKLVASDMKTKMQNDKMLSEPKLDDGDLLLQAAEGENNTTRCLAVDRANWSRGKHRQVKKIWMNISDKFLYTDEKMEKIQKIFNRKKRWNPLSNHSGNRVYIETSVEALNKIIEAADITHRICGHKYPIMVKNNKFIVDIDDDIGNSLSGTLPSEKIEGPNCHNVYGWGFAEAVDNLYGDVELHTAPGACLAIVKRDRGRVYRYIIPVKK